MKKLSNTPLYAFILGIDISKESIDACLIRTNDGSLYYQKFNNNMQGFGKMKIWPKSYGCDLETDIY